MTRQGTVSAFIMQGRIAGTRRGGLSHETARANRSREADTLIPKSFLIAAVPVFAVTSIIWIIGVSNHTFLAREIGLYIGIFFLPALLVCGCAWMIFQERVWLRVVGAILALPALGIWVLSLLLVYAGFKIH